MGPDSEKKIEDENCETGDFKAYFLKHVRIGETLTDAWVIVSDVRCPGKFLVVLLMAVTQHWWPGCCWHRGLHISSSAWLVQPDGHIPGSSGVGSTIT